jgi:hypothetical protein
MVGRRTPLRIEILLVGQSELVWRIERRIRSEICTRGPIHASAAGKLTVVEL